LKNKFFKLKLLISVLALSAGIIFLLCGFTVTVPRGVTVNGKNVGGMPVSQAARAVREDIEKELKTKTLKITGQEVYTFAYPEINYKDNLFTLLKNAERGERLEPQITYYLCGVKEIASAICFNERLEKVEPYAVFNSTGEPFTYFEGNDGREVNSTGLIADIEESLNGGFEPVTVTYVGVKRKETLENVKKRTQKLSSFTTYFDGSNLTRVSNIRLAASKISGTVLGGGKTLSFNNTVGARTKARGFLPAKIIENGEFVEGVGGGVCQVSTTLYNCALLAGFNIEEYHPHSLAVSYVPPSRDAMVSGSSCDLKIKNNSDCPAYIRAVTGKNFVTFEIYGLHGGASYSLSSEVTGSLPAPKEECDSPEKARAGKDGLTSQGYLTITRGGFEKRVLLRKDKYQPVKGLVYNGEEEQNPPSDEGETSESPPQN